MPINAKTKNKSAIFSRYFSLLELVVFNEKKESKQQQISSNAIIDANSSIMLVSLKLEICNDVITKRQNPKRLVAVPKIC
jgi:hypothetical protein